NHTQALLFGKFRPGVTYLLHVDQGVKDALGQRAPAADETLRMDDLLPSLYVGQQLALLESSGDGQLPVQVTNLSQLEADRWASTARTSPRMALRAACSPKRPPTRTGSPHCPATTSSASARKATSRPVSWLPPRSAAISATSPPAASATRSTSTATSTSSRGTA